MVLVNFFGTEPATSYKPFSSAILCVVDQIGGRQARVIVSPASTMMYAQMCSALAIDGVCVLVSKCVFSIIGFSGKLISMMRINSHLPHCSHSLKSRGANAFFCTPSVAH